MRGTQELRELAPWWTAAVVAVGVVTLLARAVGLVVVGVVAVVEWCDIAIARRAGVAPMGAAATEQGPVWVVTDLPRRRAARPAGSSSAYAA